MGCTNSTREWACSVRWSYSNPIYRLFSSQSCYRVLLGVCSVNRKLEILSNSHREFQDPNSRTRIRVISHQDLLHSLWILGATFADFSGQNTDLSPSLIPSAAARFHTNGAMLRAKQQEKGGQKNRALPTLCTAWILIPGPSGRDAGVRS